MIRSPESSFIRLAAWALIGLAVLRSPALADQALCVGVNHYVNIPDAQLQGCIGDAQSMQAVLEKYHFNVTLITDAQATRQGIIDALQQIAGHIKPSERFVFYFAGHGTQGADPNTAYMLPSDADTDNYDHFLDSVTLNKLVKSIPARSRTVILDSCFSGGMSRSISLRALKSRYYPPPSSPAPGGATRDLSPPVNGSDIVQGAPPGTDVCYFTATRRNQPACEESFNGAHHGVFTYYLISRLSGAPVAWGDLQTAVGSSVAQYTNEAQNPTLSTAYTATPIFEPLAPSSAPPAPPSDLWDAYNADHADPARLKVTMVPDETTIHVNEQIAFETIVNESGYLLLFEHGVSGNVNLIFPADRNAGDAFVEPGRVVAIPPDPSMRYAPDAPGSERIKAILCSSKSAAQALLSAMPDTLKLPYARMPSLAGLAKSSGTFDTSDIDFEVVP